MNPTVIDPNAISRVKNLVDSLVEKSYFATAGQTLNAIGTGADRGAMARSLAALETEAIRLEGLGLQLDPQNPVYRVFKSDLDDFMRASVTLIDGSAEALVNVGIQNAATITRQMALGDATDDVLRLVGVQWNVPDPDALNSIVRYINSADWQASLDSYRSYIPGIIDDHLIRDFAMGVNPMQTVSDMVLLMKGSGTKPALTVSQAESLTRTLQLTAQRDSQVLHQLANADILEYAIRIAALDDRCCLTCIALHGTQLALDERVDDHRRGRCIAITSVKGRPRTVESGVDWFNRQSDERQFKLAGGANYNALKANAVTLPDFVKKGNDPVFGAIVQENSLIGILGPQAEQYYMRNQ